MVYNHISSKSRLGKLTELHEGLKNTIWNIESTLNARKLISLSWHKIVGLQLHVLDHLQLTSTDYRRGWFRKKLTKTN